MCQTITERKITDKRINKRATVHFLNGPGGGRRRKLQKIIGAGKTRRETERGETDIKIYERTSQVALEKKGTNTTSNCKNTLITRYLMVTLLH